MHFSNLQNANLMGTRLRGIDNATVVGTRLRGIDLESKWIEVGRPDVRDVTLDPDVHNTEDRVEVEYVMSELRQQKAGIDEGL